MFGLIKQKRGTDFSRKISTQPAQLIAFLPKTIIIPTILGFIQSIKTILKEDYYLLLVLPMKELLKSLRTLSIA